VRPVRQNVDDLSQVRLRVQPVQSAARDERTQVRRRARGVIAPEEQPVLPAHGHATKRPLRRVVHQHESAVLEKPTQRRLVTNDVAQRPGHRTAFRGLRANLDTPRDERIDPRTHQHGPASTTLRWSQVRQHPIRGEDRVDSSQPLHALRVLAHRGLPELAARVAPTPDLAVRGSLVVRLSAKERVVHRVRVRLNVPAISPEHLAHHGARLLRQILEEHVLLVREHDPHGHRSRRKPIVRCPRLIELGPQRRVIGAERGEVSLKRRDLLGALLDDLAHEAASTNRSRPSFTEFVSKNSMNRES
jgi:hypothetical protein